MEGYSPRAIGRTIPGSEKCPGNCPGTHTWRERTYTVCCMDCGIEFDRKNWREIISPREAKVTAMADECDVDNVTALFDDCQIIFDGEPAKEVVYVLGMLIAHAIKEQATDKNPEATFVALREIVAIELK